MWLGFAFATLGLLIGTLVGLTAESVVQSLLGLLFAFMGGSVIALLGKLSSEDRKAAGQAIAALSISCLIGIYSGIIVTQYHLLSPRIEGTRAQDTSKRVEITTDRYLRSAILERANAIDIMYKKKYITLEQAYEELYSLASKPTVEGPQR
jgi:hypothetical protein